MAQITLKGTPIHTNGDLPAVGTTAPDFVLTDAELKAYYNAHKNDPEFKQKDLSASVRAISFMVEASEQDKKNLQEHLLIVRLIGRFLNLLPMN